MIKAGMKDDFFREWGKWFVLSDEVEDLRRPGLLKCKIDLADYQLLYF